MDNNLYQNLLERKNKGEKLDWNSITREELEKLFENTSDNMIAELFNVSKSQVKYKRDKWNIKQINYSINKLLNKDTENKILDEINNMSKERLLKKENFDNISIALTQYLFRSGPIENMQHSGKLSQEDMKILNKFMVNRIAGLLETINNGEWLKVDLLLEKYSKFGKSWDKPVADVDTINTIYNNSFNFNKS